jgi:CHAT domain-containing protein/Tfp pilus assembly protein PilF
LRRIEIEQAAIGAVTVEGLRSQKNSAWVLGQEDWSLKARPNLADDLLQAYQECRKLATEGNLTDAAARSRTLAAPDQGPQFRWLSGWLLFRIGELLEAARHFDEADKAYGQALEAEAGEPPFISAQILWARGGLWWRHSDWDAAVKYYRQALEVSRKAGDNNLVTALSLYALGLVTWRRGDLDHAEDYHRQALAIRESLAPRQLVVAKSFNLLGNVMDYRGNIAEAEKFYRRALEIREQLTPNSMDVGGSFINLAIVARERGDLAVAEEYDRRSLEIIERLAPDSLSVAISLENLGDVIYDRGDLDGAEQYFIRALSIRQKLAPEDLTVASSLHNLGTVAFDRGDLVKAEDYFRRALAIRDKLVPNGWDKASTLNSLGDLAQRQDNLSLAREYYLAALSINEKTAPQGLEVADGWYRLGGVFRAQGDLTKAEEYYRQALSVREQLSPHSTSHCESLAALAGIMFLKRQLDAAASLYEQALQALETQADRIGGSEQDRSSFRALHGKYYREYVDLLSSQKRPELAFNVTERSRARTLLETLAVAHVDIRNGVVPALLTRERSLRADISARSERRIRLMGEKGKDQELSALQKEINDLQTQYQEIQREIRATSPAYAALTQPQPLTAKEVQTQLLDSGTLLLEYSLGEERSYVFAVTPDSLNAFELPKRELIEKAARRVYSLLTARNRTVKSETAAQKQVRLASAEAEYSRAAAELSKMILGPVAAQLRNKRLLVVPDGALAYIPFSVLPEPPLDKTAIVANQPPLVVNHEIVNLPSASVLAVLRQQQMVRTPAPNAVAVLADPVFDKSDERVASSAAVQAARSRPQIRSARAQGQHATGDPLLDASTSAGLLTRSTADVGLSRNGELHLPRLRFTRREADAILAVTPQGAGKKAVDFEASRATATSSELSQYRIVHFATHGLLDSAHPELSGLVFSMVDKSGKPQNGFLELQDIYNLNLPADLVVLSACETGLGKEISGEGLVGLTRGFMYAGASRVVASLWKVSDAGTATLMTSFYTAMEKDHLPPAAALRAAQISMWKQKRWNFPYYWAAFQIQGEWK